MIQATNTLNDQQVLEVKTLIAICQNYDGTFRDPYLSICLILIPTCPPFSFITKRRTCWSINRLCR